MTRVTIELPDDLRPLAEARAAASGYPTLEAYVASLIREDAEVPSEDYGAPPDVTVRSQEELEAKLLEGLEGPFTPMTADDWAELRKAISQGSR